MNNEEKILEYIQRIESKLESLAQSVELLIAAKKKKSELRSEKQKPLPLTQEDINALQSKFRDFYERFSLNQEASVQEELEAMSPEELRRFADANNLNVTSKTPKTRVIQLIGFRFREKRQLTANPRPIVE